MNSFMQNKPNFQNAQMNVTSAQITSYQLPVTNYQYAKQTQTNPIYPELAEGTNPTCPELHRSVEGNKSGALFAPKNTLSCNLRTIDYNYRAVNVLYRLKKRLKIMEI